MTIDKNDSMAHQVLVHTVKLCKDYRMGEVKVKALCDANMEIRTGEMLCLLGPSGSGKSTLLNIIGGIDMPTSGEVFFQEQNLCAYSGEQLTWYRRHKIGFIFQFYNLVPSLTARENVELATQITVNPLDIQEVLQWVGLEERAEHFPSQLSGGEQQRVAIARAVAKNPHILLCDEPTGALDYETGKRILSVLQHINRQTGKTCVIITHNAAIGKMANRVIRMRSGQIVEEIVNKCPLDPEEISW